MARVMQALAIAAGIVFATGVLALAATVGFGLSGYLWAACLIVVVASAVFGMWAYREARELQLAATPPSGRPSNGVPLPAPGPPERPLPSGGGSQCPDRR